MNLTLGSPFSIQKENENYEFKEFCLEKNPLELKEIIDIIKNGKFNTKLNKLVLSNLFHYLQKYIPKYYASFCNSNLKSKLVIGVDDVGEITGIPFKNNISKNDILDYIKNKVFPKIIGDKDINNFNIEIIKLKQDKSLLYNNSDNLLESYFNHKKKRDKIFKEFNNNYLKWHTELEKKSGKLINILTDKEEKQNLINYIKNNNGPYEIIEYLKNNTEFIIPYGMNMKYRKQNLNDFVYWLTKYKDKIVTDLQNKKPKKPYYKMFIDPYVIINKLTELRSKFLEQVNYYLIIIEVNGQHNNKPIYFYKKNKLCYRRRINDICI